MAKQLIVGNWKAYISSLKEAKKLLKDVEKELPRKLNTDVVLCPPAPLIFPLRAAYSGKRIAFGAQNVGFEAGAHTGDTPAKLLKEVGATHIIVGHAERRAQGETDEEVAKKVEAVLAEKLVPIVCVGEASRDREGLYLRTLEESVLTSLSRVSDAALRKIVIAYEPVWAIGAEQPPTAREIRETIIFIRKVLAAQFDRRLALKVKIIYGGAVDDENVMELIENSEAGGFLLGRASVDATTFTTIVRAC